MWYYPSLMETSKNWGKVKRYGRIGSRVVRNVLGMPAERYARLQQLSAYIGKLPLEHSREQFAGQLREARRRAVEAEFRRPLSFTIHTQHHQMFEGIMRLLGDDAPTTVSKLVRLADGCENWEGGSLQAAVERVSRTQEPYVFAEENLHAAGGVRAYVAPTRLPHIIAAFNSPHLLKIESPRLDGPLHCKFFYIPSEPAN